MFDAAKVLIPFPKKLDDRRQSVKIGVSNKPYFSLESKGRGKVFEEAVKIFREKMVEVAGIVGDSCNPSYKIKLQIAGESVLEGKGEAYTLHIDEKEAVISGSDEAGVFYGVLTLGALVHMEGDTVCLPVLDIEDYPDFPERAHKLECRFGGDFMTLDDYKRAIDYFASHKINTLLLGTYGCWEIQFDKRRSENLYIPFKKYPQLKTPRSIKYYSVKSRKWIIKENVLPKMAQEDFMADVVEYALRKNIKVRLMFNSLGHNTLLPRMFPQISAQNEDGTYRGYGYCTNNDETYKIMFDLYDEIIDRFIKPFGLDSIQIGLDEVWPINGIDPDDMARKVSPYCECEKCKDLERSEILIDYIIKLCKYLKSRGMKNIYVCHDMLFNDKNHLKEELRDRFIKEDIYDVLVIVWWSYMANEDEMFHGKISEVNNLFRSIFMPMTGYYSWMMPTQVNSNIKILAKKGKELGFSGLAAYGSYEESYDKNYKYLADLAWNCDTADDVEGFEERYANSVFASDAKAALGIMPALNDIMFSDAGNYAITRAMAFYFYSYFDPEKPQPRNYPGEAFEIIKEKIDEYKKRYSEVYQLASHSLEVLEGMKESHIVDVWKLTAKQYKVMTDIFLSLLKLEEDVNGGTISGDGIINELSRLVREQESLMKMAEEVRIEATAIAFVRNLTILWLALCDLLRYCEDEIANGRTPKINLCDLSYTRSSIYDFLV